MGTTSFLNSRWTRQLNAIAMLAEAGLALRRGQLTLSLLYLVGAAVSYKNTAAGLLGQVFNRLFRRRGVST